MYFYASIINVLEMDGFISHIKLLNDLVFVNISELSRPARHLFKAAHCDFLTNFKAQSEKASGY
jgi:hypothetical protein